MKVKLLAATCAVSLFMVGCSGTGLTEQKNVPAVNWQNTNDDFSGLKPVTYADDLFLAVSKSGVYDKSKVYQMPVGYRWAKFDELQSRLEDYKQEHGSRDLGEFNYHGLGGWNKYVFEGVHRRDFIFADTASNQRVVYAGISENKTIEHKSSWDANYAAGNAKPVKNWAGFVVIKVAE